MKLYDAFLRAADRIEKNKTWCMNTAAVIIPTNSENEACVLGWVAYEMGQEYVSKLPPVSGWDSEHRKHADAMLPVLGVSSYSSFSVRMWDIQRAININDTAWCDGGQVCAIVMRAYAEKYLKEDTV